MIRKRFARIFVWAFAQAPFTRHQWVTVGMSFILAVTLWFLVTINSQTYSTTFKLPIRLANFPGEYQLISDFPTSLDIETSGLGIKLLYEVFDKGDTLTVDYNNFQNSPYFIGTENLRLIEALMEPGLKTLSISPDSVSFAKLRKASKKVPVVLQNNWHLPPSYRLTGIVKPIPDSVLLTGPVDSLALIDSWSSMQFNMPYIEGNTTFDIPLDTHPTFVVVPPKVSVNLNPEPYTEITYMLPVQAGNAPRFKELYFEPDSVALRFLVPFRLADSIQANDFLVQVNYGEIDYRSLYVLPMVAKQPDGIELIGVSPTRLKYLIISKVK